MGMIKPFRMTRMMRSAVALRKRAVACWDADGFPGAALGSRAQEREGGNGLDRFVNQTPERPCFLVVVASRRGSRISQRDHLEVGPRTDQIDKWVAKRAQRRNCAFALF